MKLRRQKRQKDEINITPLIDVVFLLLIFFMVSTTFTRETRLSVELPEAEGAPPADELPTRIDVVVDRDGSYAVNDRMLVNRKIETIMAALEQVAASDMSMPITLIADAEAPHGAVIQVMDAAGRLGFRHLNFATQEPRADSPRGAASGQLQETDN
ncbi:MAG: biopolymer transporter ExbD [Porticoccaceae bacterium]|nr:biopolymer transporter ExbD [Porticoccaceae bacterium]